MIQQGVATKADGLKVDVKVNEAEMKITQAEDGLMLSKMLLCQLCGIPMNQEVTLADEDKETLALSGTPVDTEQQRVAASDSAMNTRPELRMLQNTVDISKQATNLVRAVYLPHVALTGGYTISNQMCSMVSRRSLPAYGILVSSCRFRYGTGLTVPIRCVHPRRPPTLPR